MFLLTGVIYLAPGQSLDREEKASYRLKVVASDQNPENPRSSVGEVLIKIEDVNDSRPKFVELHQEVQVVVTSLLHFLHYFILIKQRPSGNKLKFNNNHLKNFA